VRSVTGLGLTGCGGGQSGQPAPPPVTPPVTGKALLLSALNKQGTISVMPLGDSITYGATDPTGNGYRGRLWNDFTVNGFAPRFAGSQSSGSDALPDPENEGHGGYRIDQIAAGVDGWLQNTQPEIVLLMIGTNDMPGDQSSTAPDRLSALIDQIVKDDPQGHLLVASIPPRTDAGGEFAARVDSYNAAIPGIVRAKAAAGEPVSFVDVHGALTGDDLTDGIHPTALGYAKIGDAWFEALQNL